MKKAAEMAEPLKILLVNDEPENTSPFDLLFEIEQVDGPTRAQEVFLSTVASGRPFDIIICDVNFDKSRELQPYRREGGFDDDGLLPLGPVLALPFLGFASTIFVPYSSYWRTLGGLKDKHLSLLCALGFIEAKKTKKKVPLDALSHQLADLANDNASNPESVAGDFATALTQGLEQYRKRLYSQPSSLKNAEDLSGRLDSLITQDNWPPSKFSDFLVAAECGEQLPQLDKPLHHFLGDEYGPFTLQLKASGSVRKISLASLYADNFLSGLDSSDFAGTRTSVELWNQAHDVISVDLSSIEANPESRVDAIAEEIAATLKLCNAEGAEKHIALAMEDRSRVRRDRFPELEDGLFVRFCVLCAWASAWHGKDPKEPRQSYNVINAARTNLGLTGVNPASKDGQKYNSTNEYHRLFAVAKTKEPKKDDNQQVTWARPFRLGTEGVKRWNLDDDTPADLSDFDLGLIHAFAEIAEADGGLNWLVEIDDVPTPQWMIRRKCG